MAQNASGFHTYVILSPLPKLREELYVIKTARALIVLKLSMAMQRSLKMKLFLTLLFLDVG